ncbi:hypothetical protein V1498_05475 [Peribacillus sp. SCS-26]|uniref:hypothetical protein n=1 Tax=Paraperibacillus marinus TaxID=3115295 RepID=UPI003905ACCD
MKKRQKLYSGILAAMVSLAGVYGGGFVKPKEVRAADPVHTLTFGNKIQLKTLFYPYRDTGAVSSASARGLQGITLDGSSNIYLTYSTGDKTRYGYIYKYSSSKKLLKVSKLLTIGHGQAVSYKNGYLYQLADIKGQTNYYLYKINPDTLTVVRKWKVPSTIHPNVIAMKDSSTAIAVSKSGDGYDINKIHLGSGPDATRDWREKVHIKGMIGKTVNKEIQGFAMGNGLYYLLSNGEYAAFKPDGTSLKRVSLNTSREPEGIAVNSQGKILISFNKVNEVFQQK